MMERLTNNKDYCEYTDCALFPCGWKLSGDGCYKVDIWNRLKCFEDMLGDNYDLNKFRELVEADRNGRVVILPVKLGAQVFELKPNFYIEAESMGTRLTVVASAFSWEMVPKFGDTVFLTREEAEQALEKLDGRLAL